MFKGAFSFRGRIGRLRYFLNGLLLGVLALVGIGGIIVVMIPARHDAAGMLFMGALLLFGGLALLWFDLSLHVRRLNDIGWDPWLVLPGWVALGAADAVLARLMPALSLGSHHHGTFIGAIANALLSLALLLWPGRNDTTNERAARVFDAPEITPRPVPLPRPGATPTFGRRGLR